MPIRISTLGWLAVAGLLGLPESVLAAESDVAAPKLQIPILMARELRDVPPPLSLLDLPPSDDGLAGGKLAVADNNTTADGELHRGGHSDQDADLRYLFVGVFEQVASFL